MVILITSCIIKLVRAGANVRWLLLVLFGLLRWNEAVWLNLPAKGTKCVSEDIQSNDVVLADYIVISDDHVNRPTISAKVTSPYGAKCKSWSIRICNNRGWKLLGLFLG